MKTLVVYWSGTGNTENMANGICDGLTAAGAVADLRRIGEITANEAGEYDKIALGCPAMGSESLEESEFEPFYQALEPLLASKSVALFGSFGWGDGEWMRNWEERVKRCGAALFGEGLTINQNSDSAYERAFAYGKKFAQVNRD